MRILIIEDNHRLSYELKQSLTYEGYAVDTAYDGDAGLDFAESAPYDAIILDVLLPVKDGLEVCRTLRTGGYTVPILLLTARDAIDDRVRGLEVHVLAGGWWGDGGFGGQRRAQACFASP